ncbi:MAG: hypothetical protein U0838_02290 [Chloroflexota bacterium]
MTGNTPVAASPTPSSTDPVPRTDARALPENAISRAAITEPTPVAVMSSPRPRASVWSTLYARAGVTTPKFMPNVDATPMIVIGRSSIGARQT